MNKRALILKASREAIKRGFGHFYVMPKTTWRDIKENYEQGRRLDERSEGVLFMLSFNMLVSS